MQSQDICQQVNGIYCRLSVTILPLGGVKLSDPLMSRVRKNFLTPSLQKPFRYRNLVFRNFCNHVSALQCTFLDMPLTLFDVYVQVFAILYIVNLTIEFLSSGRVIANIKYCLREVMNPETWHKRQNLDLATETPSGGS